MHTSLTISADPNVIAKARARAAAEHTTLNDVVRRFLADYAHAERGADYDTVMASMGTCRSGGRFSRDDANA